MAERYVRMNILTSGTEKAKASLDELAQRAVALHAEFAKGLEPKVDDTQAQAKLKDLKLKIQILNHEHAEVVFETKGDEKTKATLLDIKAKILKLSEMTAEPDLKLKDYAKFESQLIKAKLLLDSIHNKTVDVKIKETLDQANGGWLAKLETAATKGIFGGGSKDSGGGGGGGVLSGGLSGGVGQGLASGGPALYGSLASLLAALLPAVTGFGIGGLVGAGGILGGVYGASSGNKALKIDTSNITQLQTALKTATGPTKALDQQSLAAANKQFNKDSAFYQPFLAFQQSLKGLGQNLIAPLRTMMGPLGDIFKQFGVWLKAMGPALSAMFKASLPFLKAFMIILEQGGKALIPAFTQAMNTMVKSGALKTMTGALVLLITDGLVPFIKVMGPGMKASAIVFKAVILALSGTLVGIGVVATYIAREMVMLGHAVIDVGKIFYDIGRIIGALLTGNWKALHNAVRALGDNFRNFFATLGNMVSAGFVSLQKFGHDVASIFDKVRHDISSVFDGIRHDVAHIWNSTWDAVGRELGSVLGGIGGRYRQFWDKTTHTFDGIRHDVSHIWDTFWNAIGRRLAEAFLNEIGLTTGFRRTIAHIFDGLRHDVASIWDHLWGDIGLRLHDGISNGMATLRNFWHQIATNFDTLRHSVASVWDTMWNDVKRITKVAVSGVASAIHGIEGAFRTPVAWVVNNVWDRLAGIWNKISGIVGLGSLKLPIAHMAEGGRVTVGSGPKSDDVLARVSKGETVVSAAHSQQLAPAFSAVGVPGYAAGGIPNPISALKHLGSNVLGWLSHPFAWIENKAFGAITGMLGSIPGVAPGMSSILKSLTESTLKALTHQIQTAGAAMMRVGADSGARTHSAAVAQAFARSLMGAYGWGSSQMNSLIPLWNQESGWDAWAVNRSSGAYGIPQSLGHGHPYNLGDYKNQIIWGLNYIRGRYGSPAAAENHELAFNWYGKGGWINEPIIGRGLRSGHGYAFGELGPEYVSPAGGGGGGTTYYINVTAAPLAHPADVGREVVHAIRKYEQRSGKGWRS
jgi:phage-related protein